MERAEIQDRLANTARTGSRRTVEPGGQEERALLQMAREVNGQDTSELERLRLEGIRDGASKNLVASPDLARSAGAAAVEHVTGEHKIVPRVPEVAAQTIPVHVGAQH